jgi:hypothetical protein
MKTIEVCPSMLMPGFAGYSPHAVKTLFDGVTVSPITPICPFLLALKKELKKTST